MKRGIITAITATCTMTLLLLFLGCEDDEFFFDSETNAETDKEEVTPECIRYVDPDIMESGDGLS